MVRLSGFIIGIVIVSFIAGSLSLFLSNMVSQYGVTNYDNSSLDEFNKLSEMSRDIESTQQRIEENPPSNVLDVIGAYFSNGYEAMKLSFQSFNTFSTLTNHAVQEAKLGAIGILLKVTLTLIVIVGIIFLFVKAFVKVEV